MKTSRWLAWVLATVWSVWLSAAHGAFAAQLQRPEWVPDFAMVLFVIVAARIATDDLPKLAIAAAFARCAVSVDAPTAIFAGVFGAAVVARGARAVVDVSGAPTRTMLALVVTWGLHTWLDVVHQVRGAAQSAHLAATTPDALELAGAVVRAWPTALSSALATLLLAPLLARLPGLSTLTQDRQWHVVASAR